MRNKFYLNHYIGPVIQVEKQNRIAEIVIVKKLTCDSENCPKYHTVSFDLGFPSYCYECGEKLKYCDIEKESYLTPFDHEKFGNFHSKFVYVDNNYFNGMEIFIKRKFMDDNIAYFVPYFDEKDFNSGLLASESIINYCENEKCLSFKRSFDCAYKYCDDCGNKLNYLFERTYKSSFNDKKTEFLLNSYADTTNNDNFSLITDSDFDSILNEYKESITFKNAIDIIEKCYGSGSTKIMLANVKYHENY